jgi:hypothetical protein
MADLITELPAIEAIIQGVDTEEGLIEKLRKYNTAKPEKAFLSYKLMRYILATNRSSIRRLKPEEAVTLPQGY